MGISRTDRVNSLLLREISDDMHRVMASESIDLGLISVTRVDVAPNLRNADVWVSIMDEDKAGEWLRRLARHAADFQRLVNANMTLKYTPKIRFRLDHSVSTGDHVIDVITQLESLGIIADDDPIADQEEY